MSGGIFDWQQFSIQEIVSILEDLINEYDEVSGVDEKMNKSNNRLSMEDLNDEIVQDMKHLKERLKRDFLWINLMDKFLSGDIGQSNYFKQLEVIKFDNLDDYVIDE